MSRKLVFGDSLSKEKFKMPAADFGIFPFWFWNGDLEKGEMLRQMKEFKDKGMPGFFIHSRYGLELPYLGEEWFDRVKMVCAEAQNMGLETWVYDEHNWPSGTVGWRIPREHPDLQQRYLEMVVVDIDGPLFMFLEGIDSRYIDMQDSEPVAAFAVRIDTAEKEVVDLTPNLVFKKVISWEVPAGKWQLLYFIERRADWYIDMFNPDATKMFIDLTHEQYKANVGEFFGSGLNGFYTDEPTCLYFATGMNNYVIPWSRHLLKLFKQRNGYNLRPSLPALYLDMGEQTAKIRLDFWQTVSEQYNRAFYQQIATWCHDNNLYFTGHLLYEDWLRFHARNEGNIFNHLKQLDIVGVDHLYPRVGSRELPDQHVPHKIGSSAAHHFGSVRVLCESLGGSHWDATMQRMKWIADWEYVLGINLFNPHGFHYSIAGERKRDWPPSQFYHHTWWQYYDHFNAYIARHSYMLSGGRHIAKLAVLYPIHSMWANFTPQGHTVFSDVIEKDFNHLADALLRLHFDFDYIDEAVLAAGQVKDGKLHVADEIFEVVVLPSITTINEPTIDKLEEFVRSGGKVIATTLLPEQSLSGFCPQIQHRIRALFGLDPTEVNQSFTDASCQTKLHSNVVGSQTTYFIESKGLAAIGDNTLLDQTIRQCIEPDVEIDNTEIFYLHREKDEQDIYFFVNPTESKQLANVRLSGEGALEHWISETGEVQPVHVLRIEDGFTLTQIELEPYGSQLLVGTRQLPPAVVVTTNCTIERMDAHSVSAYARDVSDVKVVVEKDGELCHHTEPARPALGVVQLEGSWQFEACPHNALLLNKWRVCLDADNTGNAEEFSKDESSYREWMDFTHGLWAMQLDEEYEGDYPVTLWYRALFSAGHLPEDFNLIVDGIKGEYEIYLNGQKATSTLEDCPLDAMMRQLSLAENVRQGTNVLLIRLVVSSQEDGIVDPLKLIGSFSVEKQESAIFRIGAPQEVLQHGSWTTQGYPFFSGTGIYRKQFQVEEDIVKEKVFLHVDCGEDVVEVIINGKNAGVRMWNPYRLDLSGLLQVGTNHIELRITNTLINILEGVPKIAGLLGKVELIPYNRYTFSV